MRATSSSNSTRNAIVCVLLLAACVVLLRGCIGPGKVSAKTFQFAKALLLANMRRDDPRLPRTRDETITDIAGQIQAALAADEITESESNMLHETIAMSRNGDHEGARAALRELMDAQREVAGDRVRPTHEHAPQSDP